MNINFNKNSLISIVLLILLIISPVGLIPRKVKAQGMGATLTGSAVSVLPLCAANSLTGIFNGIGDLFSSSDSSVGDSLNNSFGDLLDPSDISGNYLDPLEAGDSIPGVDNAQQIAEGELSVKVHDENTAKEVEKIGKKVDNIQKDVNALKTNDSCLDGIGKLMAKLVLQKITLSTIDWINSGFEGEPTFVKQPGVFFKNIAENEILQFGVELRGLSPFSEDWLRNQAIAYQRKFADNARYSLNELMAETTPQYTVENFRTSFGMGGWDAWSYLTQVPANNPLGFKILASNELSKRLEGTEQSYAQNVRDSLQQASGFLGDERCVDPKTGKTTGITKSEHNAALRKTPPEILCPNNQWQYVTPGSMVAQAATDLVGYPKDAFLDVEDLNDAISAILDAMISHFANKWMSDGFAELNDQYNYNEGFSYGGTGISYTTQAEEDFSPVHLNSSWLKSNPNFNIRTDLTQALIDEQRTYSDKLVEQNKELLTTTDGKDYQMNPITGKSNTDGLIPTIYQLDYCIPGPHPGWENDSRKALNDAIDTILPETRDSLKDKDVSSALGLAKSILPMAAGAVAASAVMGATGGVVIGITLGTAVLPVVGTIIGAVVGTVVSLFLELFNTSKDDPARNVRAYYSAVFGGFTGVYPKYIEPNDERAGNIESKAGISGVLNTLLTRYAVIIKYLYTPQILPSVTKEAEAEFKKLKGYYQIMKKNEDKILLLKTTINILGEIKNEVDSLNKKLITKEITEDAYETALKAQINAFGRISSGMVNGNNIASADNLLKQIIDRKDYIYNNLLKGPYGCERELQETYSPNGKQTKFNWPFAEKAMIPDNNWNKMDVTSVKRMTYIMPIFYDYNKFKKGQTLPDPLNSGFINTMPEVVTVVKDKMWGYVDTNTFLGPGFLSFIYYTAAGDRDTDLRFQGKERLDINSLIPHDLGSQQWQAVGLRNDDSGARSAPWETMIGIY